MIVGSYHEDFSVWPLATELLTDFYFDRTYTSLVNTLYFCYSVHAVVHVKGWSPGFQVCLETETRKEHLALRKLTFPFYSAESFVHGSSPAHGLG